MSLENNSMSPADIAAVTGNNGNGNGWFGGDGSFWIIVLFLFAFMGNGWGNGWGGNGGGAMPYMIASNTNNDVSRGFDQQAIMAGLGNLNNGLANAEVSRCNMMGNLTNQLNTIALNQATSACNTNAYVADLKYTVSQEANNDRVTVTENTRDILENQNRNTQMILDKMCQQEIDALKAQNANLQTQLNLANLYSSQNLQTEQLKADNAAQTAALRQVIAPTPIPAYQVAPPQYYNYGYGCSGCCGA